MPKLKHKNSSMITSLLNKKYMVLLANFVFQGMRYMTRGELIFKLSFTLIFCCLFSVFINKIRGLRELKNVFTFLSWFKITQTNAL